MSGLCKSECALQDACSVAHCALSLLAQGRRKAEELKPLVDGVLLEVSHTHSSSGDLRFNQAAMSESNVVASMRDGRRCRS